MIAMIMVCLFGLAQTRVVAAQSIVRGYVVDSVGAGPIGGATISAVTSRQTATTDRFGKFAIRVASFPDTLRVAFIGRRPTAVALAAMPAAPLRIALAAAPVVLSDVIAITSPTTADPALSTLGHWQLPLDAIRVAPPAVEPDVYRALALVPAVNFSSPLSARPLIRGYGAGESISRIDGFEVINLYHLGRIFSAFPAEATEQVSVTAAPQASLTGGTLDGVIDVTGRVGPQGAVHGGGALSLASLSGWTGGGTGLRWFTAGRAVHVSAGEVISDRSLPYDFQDFYASLLVSAAGQPRGRVTAFASRDRLFDGDLGSGMNWSNVLLGARGEVMSRENAVIELSASATRFAEDVVDLPARHSRIDLQNRFGRVSVTGSVRSRWSGTEVSAGVTGGYRSIGNDITPREGNEFPSTSLDTRSLEVSAYAELSHAVGAGTAQIGTRVDRADKVAVWQPRIRFARPLSSSLSLGLGVGRNAQLYQLVSDPQAEPDLAFYDFWLSAGTNGVPTAVVDHATAEIDLSLERATGRLSVFAARGRGLAELLPPTDDSQQPGSNPFRFGKSRTSGVEAQVSLHGGNTRANSLTATYVLSWSERRWATEWVPWAQERRHLARVFGQLELGPRWALVGAFEAATGIPLTPVASVAIIGDPDPGGGGIDRNPTGGQPTYVYAKENSSRGRGTVRLDLAASYAFRGPGRSRWWAGISVLNIGFGPVAPLVPNEATFDAFGDELVGRVTYKRSFRLPAVPTLTLRAEF
jgi:hypothetical protein